MVGRLSYRLLKPYPSFNLRRSSLLGAGSIIEPQLKGAQGHLPGRPSKRR
ncbi:hypothetical protein [Methanothermobacter thermautotrophicus]